MRNEGVARFKRLFPQGTQERSTELAYVKSAVELAYVKSAVGGTKYRVLRDSIQRLPDGLGGNPFGRFPIRSSAQKDSRGAVGRIVRSGGRNRNRGNA